MSASEHKREKHTELQQEYNQQEYNLLSAKLAKLRFYLLRRASNLLLHT